MKDYFKNRIKLKLVVANSKITSNTSQAILLLRSITNLSHQECRANYYLLPISQNGHIIFLRALSLSCTSYYFFACPDHDPQSYHRKHNIPLLAWQNFHDGIIFCASFFLFYLRASSLVLQDVEADASKLVDVGVV